MKTLLIIIVVVIVIAVLVLAAWFGAFTSVSIAEQEHGAFTLVYRDMAPNEMSRVGSITTDLDALLQGAAITQRKPLDVFNPDGSGEIGFAVEGATGEQLAAVARSAKVREIPAQRYMTAEFPWRGQLSYMVGFIKVDPALTKYRTEHRLEKVDAMALNDGGRILYLQPIVKAEQKRP